MPCLTFQTFRKLSRLSGNFIFYKDFQENLITSDLNMIFVGGLERCPPGGLSAWRPGEVSAWRLVLRRLVRRRDVPRRLVFWRGVLRRQRPKYQLEECPLEACPPGGLSSWRPVLLEALSWRAVLLEAFSWRDVRQEAPVKFTNWRNVLLEKCLPWRRVRLEACPPGGVSSWRLVRWRDDCHLWFAVQVRLLLLRHCQVCLL